MHGSNVGSKIMQFVLTTLLILGVLAGGGFVAYGYLDFKTKTAEAKLQKNDRRRVRRDSLMQIRELQHKQEEADMKREVRQRVIIRFLTDFYLDAILGEGDQNSYKRFFSDRLRKEIEIIRDTCGAVGWKVFGPRRNAPDLQSLRKYLRVTHEDGDWYRVHLIQNGGTEFRYLKVHIGDRGIIMEDIR
ncbi:MAG: hypothetical protein IJV27_05400 [Prevotella sp.]|nr:hypothetical protein [Prevotella sp.]